MITDLERMLRDAIGAVTIDRHGSVFWFGDRSSGPEKATRRSLNRKQLQNELRLRLQRRLYRNFYASGGATPMADVVEALDEADVPAFIEELSKANCGRGVEESGWTLVLDRGSTAVVARNGLTVEVSSDRIIGRTKAGVTLRHLKEFRRISPGFYVANGDLPLTSSPLMRVYWNLRADGAVPFIGLVTRLLNAACIPFRAKVLNDPRSFDRCDAAVLYLARHDLRRAHPQVQSLYRGLERSLKPLTPVFTKQVGLGVGVADDPPGEESFGDHRCRIVAEALLRAHRKRNTTVQARFVEVLAAFDAQRISFPKAFLNPGSADVYPSLRP
jgi:hypothetical protein